VRKIQEANTPLSPKGAEKEFETGGVEKN